LQAVGADLQAVLLAQQVLGDPVGLQDLASLFEDDGADGELVHRAGVAVALDLDAVDLRVQFHRAPPGAA